MNKLTLGESEKYPDMNHQDMLLQICQELCDETYTECYWVGESVRFMSESGSKDIPWLELCLVHIPKALATPNNRSHDISVRQAYHLQEFYHHPRHVVDYLYSEWLDKTLWTKNK